MPVQQISFKVDLEVSYDPFKGKTPEEFAELVHDDLFDCLIELRPDDVRAYYTDVISTRIRNEE